MDDDFLLDEDEDLGGESYIGSSEDDTADEDSTDDYYRSAWRCNEGVHSDCTESCKITLSKGKQSA
jgi:hypothetical protein